MKNDIKPTFINLIVIDGKEVDIRTLSDGMKADIARCLNIRAMSAIGYSESRSKVIQTA